MTSAAVPDRTPSLETEAAARVGGLFEHHGRMVYGVCRAMLRDLHDAEDATQQVFLSAHKALLGGASVRDSGGWLATIARNECRGRIAAGMRQPLPLADADLDALPSTVDEQERRMHVAELRAALEALPDRQRDAVVLRYLYGLRYREVATALGVSRPATEALLFRARRTLQGRLRPVAGVVLAVPLSIREDLALAIPGFAAGGGSGVAAAGAAGGILAKLTAGPVGVKVATAAVAVSTVGAVGAVESERPDRARGHTTPVGDIAGVQRTTTEPESASGSNGLDDHADDRSGPGGGDSADRDLSRDGRSGRDDRARDEEEPSRSGRRGGGASKVDDDREGGDRGSDSTSGSDLSGASGPSGSSGSSDSSGSGYSGSGSSGSGSSGSGSSGSGSSGSGSSGSGSSGSGSSGSSGSGSSGSDDERDSSDSSSSGSDSEPDD